MGLRGSCAASKGSYRGLRQSEHPQRRHCANAYPCPSARLDVTKQRQDSSTQRYHHLHTHEHTERLNTAASQCSLSPTVVAVILPTLI